MKKFFKTFISLVCVFVLSLSIAPIGAKARTPLDEIQDYIIQVDMRPDGTMNIRYHIEWKVLDSTSEGPLEWVKIGCPNMHVDEIEPYTDNIKKICYYADGGAYIRVDFDRSYEKGEIVTFEYTIHQSYMYVIEEDTHLCRYSFTPGWFDDIDVKHIRIEWDNRNVIESTAHKTENNYLIWEDELDAGERLNASVKYNLDTFSTNPDEQYTEDYGRNTDNDGSAKRAAIALIVIVVIVIIIICVVCYIDDDYHGGFGGGSHTYIHTHSSCVSRSSCACASHCACACACAGGGRAGCSVKDMYHTSDTDRLLKVLDENIYEKDDEKISK
jgi:hypothetical protein